MSSALALTIRTSIITTPTSTEYGEPNKPTDYRRVSSDWRHLVNEYDEATLEDDLRSRWPDRRYKQGSGRFYFLRELHLSIEFLYCYGC